MRRNTLLSGAVIVFLASLLGGCCGIVKELVENGQSQLSAESAEAQFHFARTQVDAFKSCMKNWGGTCGTKEGKPGEFVQPVKVFRELFPDSIDEKAKMVPDLKNLMDQTTVRSAIDVLKSQTHGKFGDVFNFVAGQPGTQLLEAKTKNDGDIPEFKFTRKELHEFSEVLGDAVRFDAFQTIYAKLDQAIKNLKSKPAPLTDEEKSQREEQLAKLETGRRVTAYITSYITAYFRDGNFASIVLSPGQLSAAIASRLETSFPELDATTLDKVVKQLADGVPKDDAGNIRLIGKISGTSFKTRGGADYKFPAITATLNPGSREFITVSKVDFVGVGGDLIRVFLEAVGDAMAGVPGVTEATACKIKDPHVALPVFEPGNQNMPLTTDDFAAVNDYANRVEGAVSTVIGRVIRGANWFSLNNEAVAVLIETAVGVMAKKVSEKVIWCGYCVAHKEGVRVAESDPTGVPTLVPHGIGRRAGESTVQAKFVVVGGGRLTK